MQNRQTNASLTLTGRIDRQTHNVSDLQAAYPEWDSLSNEEKMHAARNVEPEESDTVYNVTTDELHQYFVDNLDPKQTAAKDNITQIWLGLGDNDASAVATTDTDLFNRLFQKEVTDTADTGKELLSSTFLASDEANGNTYVELGLFSGDPANIGQDDVFLLNHTTFAAVTKDNTQTVTFDVTLSFSDI